MIVVDKSAIIAILKREPEAVAFEELLSMTSAALMSAASYAEASISALHLTQSAEIFDELDDTIRDLGITIVATNEEQAREACRAFEKFGNDRSKATLSYGDCLSYALAKTKGARLLYKGTNFSETDLEPAISLQER